MSILEQMVVAGLPVTWTTVYLGWHGFGNYSRLVALREVSAYATARLTESEEQPPEAAWLAGALAAEEREVVHWLHALASPDPDTQELELRKWRLFLLERLLSDPDPDPVCGLIQLTEFWERFDYPQDSPHSVQGRDTAASPPCYYTQQTYSEALSTHRQWARREREALLLEQKGAEGG